MNTERILALKPDLVLGWRRGGNPQRALQTLASFGIPVVKLDPQSIDEMALSLEILAAYSPRPHPAQARRRRARCITNRRRSRNVMPAALSCGCFCNLAAGRCLPPPAQRCKIRSSPCAGGRNVFVASPAPWPQVSHEQVLIRHPQVIIAPGDATAAPPGERFLAAVVNGAGIAVNEDSFTRPGPRIPT